jgi:adenosine deaminase
MRIEGRFFVLVAASTLLVANGCDHNHGRKVSEQERRTGLAFLSTAAKGPAALHAFLEQFPKGADLHVHLSGAVYAETFLKDAAEDGLCVDKVALKLAKPPCAGKQLIAAKGLLDHMSPDNQDLYDRLLDSFSMRSFVATPGFSGHDEFFATFARFSGLSWSHVGEWVDEVASRAAAQNEQYLELMETPPFGHAAQVAHGVGWIPDLVKMRQALLDKGVLDEVEADRAHVRTAEAQRRQLEHCGTGQARNGQATAACGVETRYIYQVLRGFAPEQVFAQTLLGFETVKACMDAQSRGDEHEPGFVGINFVMPEDGYISMRDYELQMRMVEYLHSVYPEVHISLHAGELAPGLVPPEGLRFHIREAVELGHAERIGHGVDVMYEDHAGQLLKEMADRHVTVEINLSSNEGILGVEGDAHPFPLYMAAHVPVALSTDDEGVSRIELTHEYTRAALDYHLTYQDMKQLARTGMEHNFLPGMSLWAKPDRFDEANGACKGEELGESHPSDACKRFLDGSEKAAAQWEQERRFREFESRF